MCEGSTRMCIGCTNASFTLPTKASASGGGINCPGSSSRGVVLGQSLMSDKSQIHSATCIEIGCFSSSDDAQDHLFTSRAAQHHTGSMCESQQRADLGFIAAMRTFRGLGGHIQAQDLN